MPLHLYALINACWLFFAECPKFIGKGEAVVKIISYNQVYGTKGSFLCESGSDLFYDNGTERLSNITYCNSDASFGTRKAEVLNSLIINTTAKANDTTDILQTFR